MNQNINELRTKSGSSADLFGKDFLLTWEKSREALETILNVAEDLKMLRDKNISPRCFDSGLAISQFRDNSTRTRFSFASAANLLGLAIQDLDEGKSQIAHGETVRETSAMISFLSDIIGIRDDMFLGAGNAYMREVGAALDEAFADGVLPQRPGIINLQCDIDHPTQSMADLLHLKNVFGSLENLKGKKIAMTWAYSPSYGKPLSVPQGIIGLMTRFGMEVDLSYPEGYGLIPEVVELSGKQAAVSGGSFRIVNSMEEAFSGADIVYPKSWAPFHVMQRRTELLRKSDNDGLKGLEKECLTNNARFKDWECTEDKMRLTRGGKALYMHCLPADISGVSCKEGEVAATVFERYRVPLYKQAGFKPYIIAAMMLTNRFENPEGLLNDLFSREQRRNQICV
ncbi:MAG: knotted carbamoyltransferase YgeW [Bacteroidota bacterium]